MWFVHANLHIGRFSSVRTVDTHWGEWHKTSADFNPNYNYVSAAPNKQASRLHHVHATKQTSSTITIYKMNSSQYQSVFQTEENFLMDLDAACRQFLLAAYYEPKDSIHSQFPMGQISINLSLFYAVNIVFKVHWSSKPNIVYKAKENWPGILQFT